MRVSASVASAETATTPAIGVLGEVSVTLGPTLSILNAAWCATHAPLVIVEAALPVAPGSVIVRVSPASAARFVAVPLTCWKS